MASATSSSATSPLPTNNRAVRWRRVNSAPSISTKPRSVVSGAEILVDGRLVAKVADVLATKGDLIDGLKQELDLQAARVVVRKENEAQSKAVTIMGDKDIPYQLLRTVMFTAARANFSDVSFAVRRRDL